MGDSGEFQVKPSRAPGLAVAHRLQYAFAVIGDLRRLIAARPFVPFTIHTASGAQLRVPTVDHIAVLPTGARVIVFADDDSTILVSALLIGYITADPESARSTAA